MSLNAGDILNKRYKILSQLGRGGFGRTYKAKDIQQSSNPLCVVKEIIPPQTEEANVLQEVEKRFTREATTLARLGEHSQIPQLFDYFILNGNYYLVLEYIEGHDLSQEIAPGCLPLSESDVKKLLRDVLEALAFVHQQNIIHRDLKPSNLRRRKSDGKVILIDFGAVKELNSIAVSSPGSMNLTQAIGTPGYMGAEQQAGNPQLNSDLYSLGMICIQALTGMHPRTLPTDPNTGNIIWRYSSLERPMMDIAPDLERILNTMVRFLFSDRYYSAVEALEAFQQNLSASSSKYLPLRSRTTVLPIPSQPRAYNKILWLGLGVTLVGLGIWQMSQWLPKTCSIALGDDVSCGEEILIKSAPLAEKQEGVKAYNRGRYQDAVAWLEKARQKVPNDPETLVYLNNARLRAANLPSYTIAVAVPLGNPADGGDSGREILRGVAQLQTEVNRELSINGHGLQVVIADDYNDSDRAGQIAQKLSEQAGILGVVGHYTSDNTRLALPIYNLNNLVLISPTSTAQTLTQENTFFFRTIPQDSVMAEALADYLYNQTKRQKVVVFYNPGSAYSRSLHERFLISFDELGGQVVKQFDLSKPIFDADVAIVQGEEREATGLVLFPDAKANPYAFSNALKVIRANRNRYLMAGGDSLYSTDILQEGAHAKGLTVAIAWHYLNSPDSNFVQAAKQLWGGNVSQRTAMAYDAARTLAVVLESQSSLDWRQKIQAWFDPSIRRNLLYRSLKQPNFKTNGATGEISFELSGDRHETVVELVKVVPTRCSPYGYLFIPLKYVSAETAGLKCD